MICQSVLKIQFTKETQSIFTILISINIPISWELADKGDQQVDR